MENYKKYTEVQNIARETIIYLANHIVSGMSEIEIKLLAENYMKSKGIKDFWYYNIGAFVFVGERSTVSISGKNYQPSKLTVKSNDIVSVDLSPEIDCIWGDLSRTFLISNDKVLGFTYDKIKNEKINQELQNGFQFIEILHEKMKHSIHSDSTYDEVYKLLNLEIESHGYENLDFSKNLGHSIEKNKSDRIYIEKGNNTIIGNEKLFAFEPHIRIINGRYGFKLENIYYFEENVIKEL